MSAVTTHVLDTVLGRPAAGMAVLIEGETAAGWRGLGSGVTDADGRIGQLGPERLDPGVYRLRFDTARYFAGLGAAAFFPEVTLTFRIDAGRPHTHVPLLLSPFAYSTYRGS